MNYIQNLRKWQGILTIDECPEWITALKTCGDGRKMKKENQNITLRASRAPVL